MQTLEDLEAEKERLEREIEQKQASDLDWSAIRNRTSNDAMLNEDLKDDRGTKTSELNASAKDIMAGMNANRAAYEAGLAEAQSILDADRGGNESEASDGQDSKVKGGVTVRFGQNTQRSFLNCCPLSISGCCRPCSRRMRKKSGISAGLLRRFLR